MKEISLIDPNWKISDNEYKCPHCDKIFCKMGISTHIWRKHGEGINLQTNFGYKDDRVAWNKGLTKESDKRVQQFGDTYSIRFNKGLVNGFNGKHHSLKTKKQIGEKLSVNNKGGRCKWHEVEKPNGTKVKVQGTWERDFSKVLNIIDENWVKPTNGNNNHTFKWIDIDNENKEHSYTPDFYSPKLNKYFEIKGHWWGNDKRKMELVLLQNNVNVEIIQEKELKNYLKLTI
jgi:hypothetical protein